MSAINTKDALDRLLEVMKTLRSPEGCPWDAQQTPTTLAPYILEEAAEVVDAIESGNPEAVMDEAGDLLLQVVFLAQIYSERREFDFADIAAAIAEKLIRRHPHVFAEAAPNLTATELNRQWERIKQEERSADPVEAHSLGEIPVNLPALQRARKLLDRAEKAGLLEKVEKHGGAPATTSVEADLLGQELFALVCRARRSGLDAEQVLRQYLQKLLDETRDLPTIHRPKAR